MRQLLTIGIFLALGAASVCARAAMKPIVITGEATPEEVGEARTEDQSGFYTRIERARFAGKRSSVAEVIEGETGVQVRSAGGLGALSTVALRGASSQQVMVLLDGVPLNEAAGGPVDLSRINLADLEAIEIYRGVTPIAYGASAVGGVVNLRTLKAGDTTRGEVRADAGSFETYGLGGHLFWRNNSWDGVLTLDGAQSENNFKFVNPNKPFDPDDPERKKREPRRNADVQRASTLIKVGHNPSARQRLDFSLDLFAQDQGLPTLDNSPLAQTRLDVRNLHTQAQWAAVDVAGSRWNLRSRGYYSNLREEYDDRGGQVGLGNQHTRDTTHAFGWQNFASHPLGRHVFSTSLDLRGEQYESKDLLGGRRQQVTERDGAYLATQLELNFLDGRLGVTPTLRAEARRDDFRPLAGERSVEHLAPQLGLRHLFLPELTGKMNLGRAYRAPSFFELFGDRGFLVGNPQLRDERGDNFDIGVEAQWFASEPGWLRRCDAGISYFASWVDDVIVYTYDARGVGRAVNQSRAEIQGIEASLGLAWETQTRVKFTATLQDPKNISPVAAFDGKRLPGRYREAYGLRLEQALVWFRAYYQLRAERGIFYDSANLLRARDRDEHDVGVAAEWHQIRLSVDALNLGDENFQSFNGFPEPGRSYRAQLTYRY